jgi:ribonucleoside-triphosphate reductase
MEVRKSDNSLEEFDLNKVRRGICEAYSSVNEECPEGLIDSLINNLFIYEKITSSEIRRQVEEALMAFNKRVARAYISKYKERENDNTTLKNKNDFIQSYIAASNASTGSKYDSNANVNNKNIATLNAEIPKQGNILFNRYNTKNKIQSLFSKKLAKQYEEDLASHIIYKHDESSFGVNSPYCVAIQSYPFLLNGLRELGGLSSAPKNLDSFCGMFVNLIFAVSSQFAGAVASSGFFVMFDYFARKEWGDDYYEHIDREAKIKYENGERVEISIEKQIEQYFQQIVYSINQPAAARGFQSAFVNFGYFDKPYFDGMYGHFIYPDGKKPQWESLSFIQKKFMTWFNKERTKCMLTFPVETMSLLYVDGEFVDKEYADFTAKMYEDGHSFFTYISDSPDTLSSCCRLSNKIQENTFSFTNGLTGEATGSKSVITLNYNRIIQNFVNDVFKGSYFDEKERFNKEFKEYLIPILERVYKYHTAYNEILWDLYEANMLPVYSAGFIHLNKQYLTLGLNGLNEAWMFLGGECRYSDDYKDFCKLVLSTMKEQNTLHRTKKTMFNSEFVPAESLGVKNYKWDKADGYWVPEGRNCYTSYFFLPDDENVSVLEKFKLHGKEFVENLDGGSAAHINLKEHLSFEQYRKLLEFAGENGTNYFTFNVKNSQCENCGYISKHTIDKCPRCCSDKISYYTRIIGYLVKVDSFNEGRQIEESKRIYN